MMSAGKGQYSQYTFLLTKATQWFGILSPVQYSTQNISKDSKYSFQVWKYSTNGTICTLQQIFPNTLNEDNIQKMQKWTFQQ